ncbi:MAG: type I DNA topoisomerase [Candidatus Latescibacteria bacterium]|nr:type I DNA topoisomerase [Candidatus Latescibacterota bacterium]
MPRSLVIVESPAKARTINRFLGANYIVKPCGGHIRDLPEGQLGVDIANGFRPRYVLIKGKGKIVRALKEAAKEAPKIFLATDPDREGEAIAWHVAHEIGNGKNMFRVLLNEITRDAVLKAIQRPLGLDLNKVNAQQARRVIDRLVGYKVSPFLWQTVYRGSLSAGRVQSVALRLVCEREEQITQFVPQEYWSITAALCTKRDTEPKVFEAQLVKINGKKASIPDENSAIAIVSELEKKSFQVVDIKRKQQKRQPAPPFITSTLQQEAGRRFNFSAKKTMAVAQQLYEGIDLEEGRTGLITYMRTDSPRVAKEAVIAAREYIASSYGVDYVPRKPNTFRAGKAAQGAHEAIRPTSLAYSPKKVKKFLTPEQLRLYELIWTRFIASQMKPALLDVTTAEIEANGYLFRSSHTTISFRGFMVAYKGATDEQEDGAEAKLPDGLSVGEELNLVSVTPQQHFTEPPARYTEATLVKELEAKGIGRPSTYAPIVSIIQERGYVRKEKGRLFATDLGMTVNRLLVGAFPDIFDVQFTAKMEESLDRVEAGEEDWIKVVTDFYTPFESALSQAKGHRTELKKSLQEPTDQVCEKCGRPMVIRWGRHGRFLSCSGFPECKNARPLDQGDAEPEPTGQVCEKCGAPMVVKSGKYGRFLACSAYPRCKNTKPLTLGIPCPEPECDGEIVERRSKKGKVFYGCSNYPKCEFASWDKPVNRKCPQCGAPFLVEKVAKKKGLFLQCPNCKAEFPEGD